MRERKLLEKDRSVRKRELHKMLTATGKEQDAKGYEERAKDHIFITSMKNPNINARVLENAK